MSSSQFIGSLALRVLPRAELIQQGSTRQLYELLEDFSYDSAKYGRITARQGLLTDFASIPRAALWFVDDDDPVILPGSVIHDQLYTSLGVAGDRNFTREQADDVLREAMLASGATGLQAAVVYRAVRLGGASHWRD